jgi:vancomycin resistance protein YoaR
MPAAERENAPGGSEAVTPLPPSVGDKPEADDATTRGPWRRAWFALAPLVLLLVLYGGDRAAHSDEVLRGVTVSGVALGGMDRHAAERALLVLDADLHSMALVVTVRDGRFELKPEDVGLHLDTEATVAQAMQVGRDGGFFGQLGGWLGRIGSDTEVLASVTHEGPALASAMAKWGADAIADPPFEGAVVVKDGKPITQPPRVGYAIDHEAAAAVIDKSYVLTRRDTVAVPLLEKQPSRNAAQVETARKHAAVLLAGDIVLSAALPDDIEPDDKGAKKKKPNKPKQKRTKGKDEEEPRASFRFDRTLLASALRSRLVDGGVEVYFDTRALEPVLKAARDKLERKPRDARFVILKRDEVTIAPSRPALVVDGGQVAARLLEVVRAEQREGELPVQQGEQPAFTDAAAKALGITGLVSKFTTVHPCCRPRVTNIHLMADLIDGVILKPGDQFSINEHIGERTPKKGFLPAPTIVRGKMKDTVGGGVSQFATTFFNAAFYGAYDIVERQPHSYYFKRYPMGHEATLSFPKPDVIIKNDTEAGMLIRCYYTNASITVKMYGDNGGRKVKRKVSRVRDVTDPPIEYIADDSLEPDEEKVKERGRNGWTVIVARITEYADGKSKKEQRKVVYKPRLRTLRVHSCMIPEGEKGHTGAACPEPPEEEESSEEDVDGGEGSASSDDGIEAPLGG